MRKTTIAILLPDLHGGGTERVNLDLAYEFERAGYHVQFVLMQAEGDFLAEAGKAFSIVDLNVRRIRSLPLALTRYLRRYRPDALLASMWPLTVIAPLARYWSGCDCRVVVAEHCPLSMQYRDWGYLHRIGLRLSMAVGYRLADDRVCVSDGVVKDTASLSGLEPESFTMIHNPVPVCSEPSVKALQDAEALWSGSRGARVLTVGRMKKEKNHALLMRAFAELEQPDARLMFVGDGTERASLTSLAQELGIESRVIFAGFCHDPTPFYKTADVFALSSDYEGFGNVIVEAMACGTPVVSTDCPSGPGEILSGGRYGRLVPVGDVAALTRGIQEVLEHGMPADLLRRRAADFGLEQAANGYLELIAGQ